MKQRKTFLFVLAGLLTLSLLAATVGCQQETATPTEATTEEPTEEETTAPDDVEGNLSLAGSTTVQPLAQALADAYMAQNANVTIDVGGGGSSTGVTSAGEDTVDIGMASRNIKDSEFEEFPDLQVHTIAFDGIAIVTHPDIELESLTVEQVQSIFAGEITNFSEVGGPDAEIFVVSREEGSGTRGAFEELVMEHGGEEKLITADANLQSSNGAVRTVVAETENTIGYLSFGFLDGSVNPVPIDGVAAEVENVVNDTYPIYRPLNMVTNGPANELAQAFLDFIMGEEGQAIVAEDYIPVQ
ncbi:MAG: phosphate ABC transporter substrate-binding protein [Anaerolineae bacterium]|jgi:phosphate transport system substrate-binding protein